MLVVGGAVEDAVVVDADARTARPCVKQERHKHASPGSGGPVGGTCMHQQLPVGLHSISAPQRLHDGIFVFQIWRTVTFVFAIDAWCVN